MKSSRIKKVLFTMLALVAVFMLFSVTAYADDYGNFSYSTIEPEDGESFDPYIEIVGYSVNDEELGAVISVPSAIEDVPVTTIAASAFSGKELIGEVIIPDSVTTIENAAFSNCKDLKVVVIPDSVTYIGESAFQGCGALEYVIIGNGTKIIGDIAFKDCASLKVLSLGESVETVGSGAFFGCPELKAVRVPASVKNIESLAFGFVQDGNIESAVEGFTFYSESANDAVLAYNAKYSVADDSQDASDVATSYTKFAVMSNSAECAGESYVNIRTATESFEGLDVAVCDTCAAVVTRPNTDIVEVETGSSALITLIIVAVLIIAFAFVVIWYVKMSKKRKEASIAAYKAGKPMPDAQAKAKEDAKAEAKYAKKRAKQEANLRKYIDV